MRDVIFDGLVGPTYTFSGLGVGNLASKVHKEEVSSPKQAALEGLHKMKQVADLGVLQAVLPPQLRPSFFYLRQFGFEGSDEEVIQEAAKKEPRLLWACSSAASVWAANSATVTPSADAKDRLLHISIANQSSAFHRSIEAPVNLFLFKHIFKHVSDCAIHPPLHGAGGLGDEGSANHIRLTHGKRGPGVHLLVYGKKALNEPNASARASLEAQEALCRRHRMPQEHVVFARQSVEALESGVFHNDVIAMGLGNLLILHEKAYENTDHVIHELKERLPALHVVIVQEKTLPLKTAVETYLFNSEIIAMEDASLALVVNQECQTHPLTKSLIDRWLAEETLPIEKVVYVSLKESLKNGGGPACLSLRVPLSDQELSKIDTRFMLSTPLYQKLVNWVETHYRDQLTLNDLGDPLLYKESIQAFESLSDIFDYDLEGL